VCIARRGSVCRRDLEIIGKQLGNVEGREREGNRRREGRAWEKEKYLIK